jgi:hypothetical protein
MVLELRPQINIHEENVPRKFERSFLFVSKIFETLFSNTS